MSFAWELAFKPEYFHPVEDVSRCRIPKSQVVENNNTTSDIHVDF